MTAPLHREACEKMLAAWDSGEIVWSIELGGLGPGYEQAIQVFAIECVREGLDAPDLVGDTDEERYESWRALCDRAHARAKEGLRGGLSGAQFGVGTALAWSWLHGLGPLAVKDQALREKRAIQISAGMPDAALARGVAP